MDWDGSLVVSSSEQQQRLRWKEACWKSVRSLRLISSALERHHAGSEAGPEDERSWREGERCVALFHLDKKWYRCG